METQNPFSARIATTPGDKKLAYKLRYQSFCVDYHYLPADDYPDGLETDQWDTHSVSFLLSAGDEPVGTARLIPNSSEGFQTESYANLPADVPREHMAEVSRLTLLKRFAETNKGARRAGLLVLNRLMFQYSLEHGIYFWFTTMFLLPYRIYSSMGIPFLSLSHELKPWPDENGGLTVPQLLDLRLVLPYLYLTNRGLYRQIAQTEDAPGGYNEQEMHRLKERIQQDQAVMMSLIDKA